MRVTFEAEQSEAGFELYVVVDGKKIAKRVSREDIFTKEGTLRPMQQISSSWVVLEPGWEVLDGPAEVDDSSGSTQAGTINVIVRYKGTTVQ
jgi:hypothetical protein